MGLAKERLSYLESEVLAEKNEDAFERAHVARTKAEKLWVKLHEEVILQETFRQEVAQMTTEAEQQRNSKAFETAVIEKYHDNYLGKVEEALACKVGFNYLKGQLRPELLLKEDRFKYPSQVANCLDVPKTLEVQGGLGIMLEEDEGAEEEGEEEAASEDAGEGLDDDANPSSSPEKPNSPPSDAPSPDFSPTQAPDIAS